jgi:hypothetical protein
MIGHHSEEPRFAKYGDENIRLMLYTRTNISFKRMIANVLMLTL